MSKAAADRSPSRPGAAPGHAPVRRHLSERQADTVARLAEAAVDEVRAVGYDGLTVRNVARRAGVAPATAYTYFASKDHLVADVFWRRLRAHPPPPVDRRRRPAARVVAAVADVAEVLTAEPELAAAGTTALLASDPDVARLRELIGLDLVDRLTAALDDGAGPAVVDALSFALSGAMLQAGMGIFPHAELADRLTGPVRRIVGDGRSAGATSAPTPHDGAT